jgi:hypothetical protein
MKIKLLYLGIIILTLTACSKSLHTSLYDENSTIKNNGVAYNLPMNLLKVEITYTVNEPRIIINGKDESLTPKEQTKITIEDPIIVSSLLVADKSKTYLIKSHGISKNFFLKSDVDIKLSDNGLLSSIDSDIEDNSIDFAENLIVSTVKLAKSVTAPNFIPTLSGHLSSENFFLNEDAVLDGKSYKAILDIQENILAIKKKEELELAIKKIEFYKNQIDWYQKNFKTYIKKSKVKYTIIVDPAKIYSKKGSWSLVENNKIYHNIFPAYIFPNGSILEDTITLELPKINSIPFDSLNGQNSIRGIVYRSPSNVNIDITSNGNLLANNSIYLAQFGRTSILTVDSKRGGKKKTSLIFSSITGGLTNQKVVAGSSSEKLSKSIKNSMEAVNETVEYLKFEAEIKDLEKQNSIKSLKDSLKEVEEIEESETEFEKKLREANEKQQLLDLELLIKKLQKQIEELESEN